MLRTRLWMGTLLIGLGGLILLEERWLSPWFPILFAVYLCASVLAVREFVSLLPAAIRPSETLTVGCICVMATLNWWPTLERTMPGWFPVDAWHLIGACAVAGFVGALLRELWRFRGPDQIVIRVGLTTFAIAYLGVLPSFLAQLRFIDTDRATIALALAVFVTKGNDIGAYFTGKFLTGRILGRTPMTPLLSPKKTWQGAIGGMAASILVAVFVQANWPIIPGGWLGTLGFALSVGLAGILGDLAESLIKRDLMTKDASQTVPGFGGVLDVVDSLLFGAPVVWIWLG